MGWYTRTPLPLLAARLTGVVESVVSMLLYWSSSATPTEKVAPAVVEVGGLVVYTSLFVLAAETVVLALAV